MLTLDLLPHEVIEHVLSFPEIDICDLCRCSEVCSTFREVICSNDLWKKKFARRWPELFKQGPNAPKAHWREECSERLVCGSKLRQWVSRMSHYFYSHDELSKDAFDGVLAISDHPRALQFFIDELASLLDDQQPSERLTLKYYARRVQCFVRHEHLKRTWSEYLDSVPEPSLEVGALLLSQWCQPLDTVPWDRVCRTLDELATRARACVATRHPNHPLCRSDWTPQTAFGITESKWPPAECRIILVCINQVLFQEYGLTGDLLHYNAPENSLLDKVRRSLIWEDCVHYLIPVCACPLVFSCCDQHSREISPD